MNEPRDSSVLVEVVTELEEEDEHEISLFGLR